MRVRSRTALVLLALLPSLAAAPWLGAQEVSLEPLLNGLVDPVAITHAGDERLFVTLQPGQVVIWDGSKLLARPFLDIRDRVGTGGERGLLSVAFHPDYLRNGFFFVNYTNVDGDTVIARYRVGADPNRADPGSEAVLLEIEQPFVNHNGGQLQFGPDDMLWIGMGDGGSGNDPRCNAQRGDTLLGKMLRLDVDRNVDTAPFYAVPIDNPFVGSPDQPDEVWALGLRNPWRFSFDRQTGDLWIGDVGQSAREEIDRVPAGSPGGLNFGWKMLEGTLCLGSSSGCGFTLPGCSDPAYTPPVLEYGHDQGCSVTGGTVYRGNDLPSLEGRYLYGDYCSGTIWAARRQGGGWTAAPLPIEAPELVAFGEDSEGELYLATLGGTVYRIAAAETSEPGTLETAQDEVRLTEGSGSAEVVVRRAGGTDGEVTVRARTVPGSARPGVDYQTVDVVLAWPDGDDGDRTVEVPLIDDAGVDGERSFVVELAEVTGGAELGRAATTVVIEDDDLLPGPCVESEAVLCLRDGRFRVEIEWRDFEDRRGRGSAERLTSESGFFWFFREDNLEVVVKVLDACSAFDRFWVFAAGLTNVETRLTVVDTATGTVRTYDNDLGSVFQPVQDVDAFATCP